MSHADPTEVYDTNGANYQLGEKIGDGGQGRVFRVKNRALVVKLLNAGASDRSRIQESIQYIKRLPIDDLHVARPLRALADPHLGYVMEFMTEMAALSK